METPGFFINGYYGATAGAAGLLADKRASDQKPGDHFTIDDLLDFPNDYDAIMNDGFFDNPSNFTSNDSSNSSGSAGSGNARHPSFDGDSHQFASELCVPYDDLAELEWLSNFVEDSFSTEQNLQANPHTLSGSRLATPGSSSSETHAEPIPPSPHNPSFHAESPLPGKARSKRSRVAPGDWSTRLLHLSPTTEMPCTKQANPNLKPGLENTIRKCLHCASERTPQWRTGPMGPKTLCNACGVRYKSGRLVPEYRPAASPTFASTKHSNSHRKVLELRRQKALQSAQHEKFLSQSSIFGLSNGGDDFMIHHHGGPNFSQMI